MVKGMLVFIVFWFAVTFTITQIRHMTGQAVWSLTKTLTYGIVCALIALIALVGIVILF